MGEGQRQRLRSIQEAARNSVGCEFGTSIAFEAKMLVDHLIRVREMITETDARIAATCRQLPGLDLSASRSGKSSEKASAKISKKGKAALRYALYQSALIATTRNKYFIEYFSKLIAGREREQGIKTKMRFKVAAKMLVIAWTLWKNEEVFQGKYLLR